MRIQANITIYLAETVLLEPLKAKMGFRRPRVYSLVGILADVEGVLAWHVNSFLATNNDMLTRVERI